MVNASLKLLLTWSADSLTLEAADVASPRLTGDAVPSGVIGPTLSEMLSLTSLTRSPASFELGPSELAVLFVLGSGCPGSLDFKLSMKLSNLPGAESGATFSSLSFPPMLSGTFSLTESAALLASSLASAPSESGTLSLTVFKALSAA